MRRFTVLCCVLLVAVLNTSCSQASEPTLADRGPVWAYGTEVNGEPWFEEREGVAYYQGVYQYWPRAPRPGGTEILSVPPEASIAYQILSEASAASYGAKTQAEWAACYEQVLEVHRNVVISYTTTDRTITIQFAGVPFACVIGSPFSSTRSGQTASDPDSTRQAQIERFWKFYNNGSWIFWGSDYFTVVPPVWQGKTIAAIDQIVALVESDLTGDALQSAINRVDVKNTALEEDNFLRDLIAHEGR